MKYSNGYYRPKLGDSDPQNTYGILLDDSSTLKISDICSHNIKMIDFTFPPNLGVV